MIYVQYFDLSERKAYDKLNPNRDALTQKAPTMLSFFFFFFFFFFLKLLKKKWMLLG